MPSILYQYSTGCNSDVTSTANGGFVVHTFDCGGNTDNIMNYFPTTEWATMASDMKTVYMQTQAAYIYAMNNAAMNAKCQQYIYGNQICDYGNTGNTLDNWTQPMATCTAGMNEHEAEQAILQTWLGQKHLWPRAKTPVEKAADAVAKMKEIIKQRQSPMTFVRRHKDERKPLPATTDARELRARDLIRRILGDDQYENLQTKGFVVVKGKSGKKYLLRPGYSSTIVYENGRKIANLCIQVRGDFPPCDALALRAMLVWNNEDEFWKKANKSLYTEAESLPFRPNPLHEKTLLEQFKETKRCAGLKLILPMAAVA